MFTVRRKTHTPRDSAMPKRTLIVRTLFALAIVAVVIAIGLTVFDPGLALRLARDAATHAGWVLSLALAKTTLPGILFAGPPAVAAPAPSRTLAAVLADLRKIQDEHKGKEMPAEVGERFTTLAKEAKQMQDEQDRETQLGAIEAKSREVVNPALPAAEPKAPDDPRPSILPAAKAGLGVSPDGTSIVGYVRIGQAFVRSKEYQSYVDAGMAAGTISPLFQVRDLAPRVIPVTQKMLDTKAVPVIGADVIRPDRIAEVVRVTEPQRLRMRDVLNVSQTQFNAVEYVTIVATPEDAAPVAESGTKPESDMEVGTATAPVRTIAHWLPVTEQMLQDAPAVAGMIDNELLFDLDRVEERQFLYGSGAGQNYQGINTLAGVPLITRTVTNTTIIDRIRIGVTDVLLAGYEPNGLVIHPLDWESAVLAKGTDDRYVWVLVTDPQTGNSRIWGLGVVETVAAKNPANLQRYFTVGDFIRGATVWDRQQAGVQVGWINDQFIKNQRTIRAEKRAAFGIKRPLAFAKYETATAT